MSEISEWFTLDPNDFSNCWWRKNNIVDEAIRYLDDETIMCYYIIQDGNMGGNYLHIVKWYINNRNRYTEIINETHWFLNKRLEDINNGDIVYTIYNPYEKNNIRFKAYNCPFANEEQQKYVKILERI